MTGIILINKPPGYTSFDVIARLRGILKTRRLGHSGTLDPMATGVLPVFVGTAAKAADMLSEDEKCYTAGFSLGFSTDTQDVTGNVTARSEKRASRDDILSLLPRFSGDILQLPPMYSAVRVNGKRLYELARRGETVERQKRCVRIYEIRLDSFDEAAQTGILTVSCSKGTYIRTLINDLGEALGTLGVMTSLVRTRSQGFELKDCLEISDVEKARDEGRLSDIVIPVDRCFESYPEIELGSELERLYKNGIRLDSRRLNVHKDGLYRVYGQDFLGVARMSDGLLISVKNFFGSEEKS